MVCQKSRDRQSTATQKRSLPPKKRGFANCEPALSNKTIGNKSMVSQVSSLAPPQSISVVTDDRSVGNSSIASQASGSSNNKPTGINHHPTLVEAQQQQKIPASFASAATATSSSHGVMPFVSNDSTFVATALKQRDEQEVLRAAQAMLYDSYMQALQQQNKETSS